MRTYVQVTTTAETKADAQAIADAVVEKRLAACAQIIGLVTSTYWWQGEIEIAEEWLCVIKSKAALYEELEKAIRAIHPYEEPEIIATPIIKGSKSYLAWLDENTR
ncbi:MAG: divalent-cation tolerance protein CutA [Anaerolineae bacterium]|jgi:periplasmic divalent cation tolerance protein|nr:divalent-cation tolerance protein CutA [Anaerolineae bacterium]